MAKEPMITITGNLTSDPELKFTSNGVPVAKFTIAQTPSFFNKGAQSWEDGETIFMNCTVWRQTAENVAESLQKGFAVIAHGRLKSRTFETKEGQKRTVMELEVDSVGPDLTRATAKVTKNASRSDAGGEPAPVVAESDPF